MNSKIIKAVGDGHIKSLIIHAQPATGTNTMVQKILPDAVRITVEDDRLSIHEFFALMKANSEKTILLDTAHLFSLSSRRVNEYAGILLSMITGRAMIVSENGIDGFDFTGQLIITMYSGQLSSMITNRSVILENRIAA